MAKGAGTAEGYIEPGKEPVQIRRTRPVWARVPTAHEGPPYAWRTEEREP